MKHGAQYAYKVKKCRCPDCKAWWAAETRKYRRARIDKGQERLVNGRWVMVQNSLSQ